jgi:uncharacterized protein (DUF58 family)
LGAELETAAARWRLAVPRRRLAGRLGDRAGRGLGSSIEFEDHRPYQPGDDPRHVDWRAYARTDRLEVRLYREEVAPALDLVVDTSASMAVTPQKRRAVEDLVLAARRWAGLEGATARAFAAGGGRLEPERPLVFSGGGTGLAPRAAALRPNGLRLLVSDFLTETDPLPGLARIAAGAAHCFVVQLLDPWEAAPEASGPVTLVDVEDGRRIDLDLDPRVVAGYLERLGRLREELAAAVRRVGGSFASVVAGAAEGLFEQLGRQRILEPA